MTRRPRAAAGNTAPKKRALRSEQTLGARERARIEAIVAELPEGAAIAINTHLRLEVRKKLFGCFMVDHHGDGRIQLNCKAAAEMHDVLQQLAPAHFHVPKYVGNKGWIGLWLDVPRVDWATVELAVRGAYQRVAPKMLAARLDTGRT